MEVNTINPLLLSNTLRFSSHDSYEWIYISYLFLTHHSIFPTQLLGTWENRWILNGLTEAEAFEPTYLDILDDDHPYRFKTEDNDHRKIDVQIVEQEVAHA
jgi:hypothetical protein